MPDIVKLDVRGEAAVDYAGVFRGRPDEVSRARGALARYLVACPVADDAVLIASELAANAVVHSGSRGQFFAVRCALRGRGQLGPRGLGPADLVGPRRYARWGGPGREKLMTAARRSVLRVEEFLPC